MKRSRYVARASWDGDNLQPYLLHYDRTTQRMGNDDWNFSIVKFMTSKPCVWPLLSLGLQGQMERRMCHSIGSRASELCFWVQPNVGIATEADQKKYNWRRDFTLPYLLWFLHLCEALILGGFYVTRYCRLLYNSLLRVVAGCYPTVARWYRPAR